MLVGFEDKSAYALCTLSFVHFASVNDIKVFTGKTPGKIVPARGPKNFGWDPVFEPDGFDKTYGFFCFPSSSVSHSPKICRVGQGYQEFYFPQI